MAKIFIKGDGIIARLMHLALLRSGIEALRIGHVEREYANDPRSYAIDPKSMAFFREIGLEGLGAEIVQSAEIAFGETAILDWTKISHETPAMFMVEHKTLQAALNSALPAAVDENALISLANQKWEYHKDIANLLIIAEGQQSPTARKLGIAYEVYDYHSAAITMKLNASIAHEQIARQVFTSHGPLGILPHKTHEISVVWSLEEKRSQGLMAMGDAAIVSSLQEIIEPSYGAIRSLSPAHLFHIHNISPSRLYGEGFVLIGDSAHRVHPMAGQGLNLGIRDVQALSERLTLGKMLGEKLGNAEQIADYAQSRASDIAKITSLTRGLHMLTVGQSPRKGLIRQVLQSSLESFAGQNLLKKLTIYQ